MAGKIKKKAPGPAPDPEHARLQEQTTAVNERLILSSIHQHELREVAEKLNVQLQAEIAEREKTEEKLRESEMETKRARDYAEATLRTAPIPLLVLRADLRVNTANDAFYKNFQVAPAETEGDLIYNLGNRQWNIPRLRELLEEILPKNNFFKGFEITHEFEAIGRRTLLLNARRMENEAGQPLRIVLAIEDITERKQMEEALRETAERLRFMDESMPQKIFTAKPSGDVDYFNRQWTEFTGLSFEQIRDWGWLQFIHPDDVDENVRRWKYSIETGDDFQIEHRFRRKDGEYRWHLSRAHAMRDANGEVSMWIGSNTEIDDQKRAEQAMRESQQQAEAANRAKDQFLAMLSHELRTPLTPVLMTVAALQRDPGLSDSVRSDLEVIERNIELEALMIDDLLDVTRIAHGKLELHFNAVDIHGLLEHALTICAADLEQKKLRVTRKLAATERHTWGDAARLQQVFWNLIKNAIKFTPQAGEITITTRNDAAHHIVIAIADSGVGIDPDLLPRIFNAFEQGGRKITSRYGGLGLGLAISKSVVDLHHGTISVLSGGRGSGSTFTITLQAIETSLLDGPVYALDGQIHATGSQRILLVEDHEDTARVLRRMLDDAGYLVALARSVQQARDLSAQQEFDLVISDVGLPDGNGLDLMRGLRESRDLTGIALSGFGTEEDVAASHAAGFAEHLTKPVDWNRLRTEVERLLARTPPAGESVRSADSSSSLGFPR